MLAIVLVLLQTVATSSDLVVPFLAAANRQVGITVGYDGSYRRLAYPGGDVPATTGVCTDVVIRAYRGIGVDLQVLVHEDLLRAPDAYPKRWGARPPDTNIDHRRVPNLAVFFSRHGLVASVNHDARSYQPGDLVTWRLPSDLPHIGIVSDETVSGVPLIIHNIGEGTRVEDVLFRFEVTGHYRFLPKSTTRNA